MPFRTAAVRRNVSDNIRRAHAMPAIIDDCAILDLVDELSFMDGDEFHAYLEEEYGRLGDWQEVVRRNLSVTVN